MTDGTRSSDLPHPWQRVTVGSGLMLHAPVAIRIDADALRAEFDELDRRLDPAARGYAGSDGSWSSVTLVQQSPSDKGISTPALDLMPSVAALLAARDWTLRGAYLIRQPPGGTLPWHFDNQAPHLEESRVLIPVVVPPRAVTLIGHERVAYPAGVAWAGDFSFPHQVDNPEPEQRVVLALDVRGDDRMRALVPPEMTAHANLRHALAETACNQLRRYWAEKRDGAAGLNLHAPSPMSPR